MLPDRVSNPGPLTYESGALPIALRGPAPQYWISPMKFCYNLSFTLPKQSKDLDPSYKMALDFLLFWKENNSVL